MDKKEINSIMMQARQRAVSADRIKDAKDLNDHISVAFKLIIGLCDALLKEEK